MKNIIVVAGATGTLGQKICLELIKRNIKVRAIIREKSNQEKVDTLEKMGVEVFKVELSDEQGLQIACTGVSCVISSLAGLHDVIVEAQTKLLKAAISVGVHCIVRIMAKGY